MGHVRASIAVCTVLWVVQLISLGSCAPLVVLAGHSRVAWLPDAHVDLEAKVVNLVGGIASVRWSVEYGAARVIFNKPRRLVTKAKFQAAGTYLLRCWVKPTNLNQKPDYGRIVVEVYTAEQNFGGYSTDFLRAEYGKGVSLKYDFEGYDFTRFARSPPKWYKHPRIYLNPGKESEALRRNLQETEMGLYMMTRMNATLARFKAGEDWAVALEQLARDPASRNMSLVPVTNANFVSLLGYEIFMAFVRKDWKLGVKAVQVLAMVSEELLKILKKAKQLRYKNTYDQWYEKYPQRRQAVRVDYREYLQGIVHRKTIATAYDFGFMFMGSRQRESVRALLLTATEGVWCIGMDSLPALQGMRSNWIVSIGDLLVMTLAVEGETSTTEGLTWNKEMFARTAAGYERFISVGFAEDGTSYEGMGKNQLHTSVLAPLAKRRIPLIASLNVRNHIRQFYAYSVFPWGRNNEYSRPEQSHWAFTWDEALGGSRQPSRYEDITTLRAAFPSDEKIALIARAEMQDNFMRLNDFNVRVYFKAMEYWNRAMFIQPMAVSETWSKMYQRVMANTPKTYFSDYRGLAIMVDRWHPQGLHLHFQPRHLRGGHVHFDRNKICFYGYGRTWIECTGSNNPFNYYHAVISIDGNFRKPDQNPGKMVAKLDSTLASFYAGDVRASYGSFSGLAPISAGAFLYENFRPFTLNDHRFSPGATNGNQAKWSLPNWKDGLRNFRNNTGDRFHPVQGFVGEMAVKAFRTAGLVRGTHPYSLIIDDIQRFAANSAKYTWMAPILKVLSSTTEVRERNYVYDRERRAITFTDPTSPRNKFLLWFVDAVATPELSWNRLFRYTLEMSVTSLKPDFKVLLYPYVDGKPLPSVDWEGNRMTISFFSTSGEANLQQRDVFTFVEDPHGRTRFTLERTHPVNVPNNVFDFTADSTVSPTGGKLRIPDLQNIREPFDQTINKFTSFWEAGICPSATTTECTL